MSALSIQRKINAARGAAGALLNYVWVRKNRGDTEVEPDNILCPCFMMINYSGDCAAFIISFPAFHACPTFSAAT